MNCICIFTDIFREAEKVIIALTHFEKWYTTDLEDQRLTIEDLRKKVCKIISETVGIKVSEEVIIPVCAEWGFTARQLQYGSQETEVKEQALKYLQSYTKASGDQYQQLCNLTPTEIGVKLLKASGIQDLEQRLKNFMTCYLAICLCHHFILESLGSIVVGNMHLATYFIT